MSDRPKVKRVVSLSEDHEREILLELRTATEGSVVRPAQSGRTASKPMSWTMPSGRVAILKRADQPGVHMAAEGARHEAAAYELGKICGLDSFIPPTVHREIPNTSGGLVEVSLQLIIPNGDELGPLDQVPDEDIIEAGALEFAMLQVDRVNNNWLTVVDEKGVRRLVLYDNGMSFDWPTGNGQLRTPRSSVFERAVDLGGPAYDRLEPLLSEENLRSLRGLLTVREIERMVERIRKVRAA